jgi:hypothetical protein
LKDRGVGKGKLFLKSFLSPQKSPPKKHKTKKPKGAKDEREGYIFKAA